MKGLTKTTLWEFLEQIRERTRENVTQIKRNNETINGIERDLFLHKVQNPERVNELKIINKQLSEENYQLLELHKNIISLGERYGLYNNEVPNSTPVEEEKSTVDNEEPDYVKMALEGRLDYETPSACLLNGDIREKIYTALLKGEMYEDCAKIMQFGKKNVLRSNPVKTSLFGKFIFWKK